MWSFARIQRAFTLHGKVASTIKRGGLSVFYQLHITILTLPTNNYKRKFELVEVIIRNIISFFHLRYSKNGIFDNVIIITSTLQSDKQIWKANFTFLVKHTFGIMCAENCEIRFKFVIVIQGKL